MNSQQERRVDGIQRVPVQALVEVCGLRGDVPSFEAESRNVSDRGIRLRTAYLPELGAPVVCRFESEGQEVLAEGVIAWCNTQSRGGEFGVRFTALNSKSAQVLGQLCRGEPGMAELVAPVPEASEPSLRAGTKVKLHIDGLSSPMRARVQQNDAEQIRVNSSLEFLRLGKRLQLENVEAGAQSEAYIDGIDVIIDPESGVPNLVVLLRSQENEQTPEPSVIDTANREIPGGPQIRAESAPEPLVESEQAAADAVAEDVLAMRGKLEQSLTKVGLIVRITGASIGRTLRDRGVPLVQRMAANVTRSGARRARSTDATPPRRRTAPPPSQASAPAGQGLRPQASSPAVASDATTKQKTKISRKAVITSVGAAALLVTVVAVASRAGAPSVASNSSNPLARAAANGLVTPESSAQVPQPGASAVVAPVPLFGPTPMATLEPAPLGNPPAAAAVVPPSGDSVAERELAAAKSATAEVATGSEEPSEEPTSGEGAATKPEDVAPWGKGKMRDPVIYRIKLDGPGNAIQGTSFSKGFSVIIPKRKVEENPKGFVKQDDRLEKVAAANGDIGTKIIWRFKEEPPPGYRVRLRKNMVEFLISTKSN